MAASPSSKPIFSNERAFELTPNPWRWYKHPAPGGPLSQLTIHQFYVLHDLGGEIVEASSMASKPSPVGAEVEDQSMTLLKFTWAPPGPRPVSSPFAYSAPTV